eukprot:s1765_g14.t1
MHSLRFVKRLPERTAPLAAQCARSESNSCAKKQRVNNVTPPGLQHKLSQVLLGIRLSFSMLIHVNVCSGCKTIHSHSSETRALRPFGLQMASRRMNSTKDLVRKWPFPAGNSGALQATDPCARKLAVSACLPVECRLLEHCAIA